MVQNNTGITAVGQYTDVGMSEGGVAELLS